MKWSIISRCPALVLLLIGCLAQPVSAQDPAAAERAAAIKAQLAKSQTALRRYEWLETTVVSLNGEEQSRKERRCFYGADGRVQKVLVKQSASAPKVRAAFGLEAGNSEKSRKDKEATAEYLEDAEKLIHQYIPLNQSGIQAADKEGKLTYQLVEKGKRGRLTIRNFLKTGDSVDLDMDLVSNRPLIMNISSYLNFEVEPVMLTAAFGTLDGSVIYTSETVLEVMRRNLKVTVQNNGYHKKEK